MSRYTIEFIGGPFDGHHQTLSIAPEELAPEAVMPVSRNMFRLMEARVPTRSEPLTSIAIYRRDESADGCRYRFVAARSPTQLRIEG